MEKNYKHLTLVERDRMMEMLFEGRKQSEIARELGRDKGTISRELKRNSSTEYKKYLSHRAHERGNIGTTPGFENPNCLTFVF